MGPDDRLGGFGADSDEAERLVRPKANTQSERSRTPRPSEGEQPDRSPVTGRLYVAESVAFVKVERFFRIDSPFSMRW